MLVFLTVCFGHMPLPSMEFGGGVNLTTDHSSDQLVASRKPRCASSPEPLSCPSPNPNTTATTASPRPPTITVATEEDSSHLDLFYLDNDREDDDLLALSTNESQPEALSSQDSKSNSLLPPGGLKFSNGSPGRGASAGAPGEGREGMEETSGGEGGRGGGGGGGGGGEGMDDKLERLRLELMREVRERESPSGSEEGGRSGEDARERQGQGSTGEEGREMEEEEEEEDSTTCDYGSPSLPTGGQDYAPYPQTDSSHEAAQNGERSTSGSRHNHLYANAEDIANFLRSRGEKDNQPVVVFPPRDLPDGGMFSRPPPPPEEEEEEEEEEVVFPSLPPLTCQAHLGNEEKMRGLMESAVSALAQVVPMIHSSLSEWWREGRRERGRKGGGEGWTGK